MWVFLALLPLFYHLCVLLHSPRSRNAGWNSPSKHPGCCSRLDVWPQPAPPKLQKYPFSTELVRTHSLIPVAVWQLILKAITICSTEPGSLKSYKFCDLLSNIRPSWMFGCLATAKFGTHPLVQNHWYNGEDLFSYRYLELPPFWSSDINSDGKKKAK